MPKSGSPHTAIYRIHQSISHIAKSIAHTKVYRTHQSLSHTVWICKNIASKVTELWVADITQQLYIFTNLITIFVLALLAPYFPFPLIIMSIYVMESFIWLFQLIKILQYDQQKLMSLWLVHLHWTSTKFLQT